MLRYADLRLDASSLKEMPDGSLRVTGQLTQPGILSYLNPDGSERKEYRPPSEVFSKDAMATFAGTTLTINHPRAADGNRLVTPATFKSVTIGHVGDNVREDAGVVAADLYIKEEGAIRAVRAGHVKHISLGYKVDYDPTPGTTPEGARYDGVQRNIRGNHVALLPMGVSPRGGEECVLRLDSSGDELKSFVDEQALKDQIAALNGELAKARTDAAELPKVRADLTAANARIAELGELLKPERLDAVADARAAVIVIAKADGIPTAGVTTVALKRAIVAKRTPDLAARVDSMDGPALDAVMVVYAGQPHPSLAAVLPVPAAVAADAARTDAAGAPAMPKYADMYNKHLQGSLKAWQNSGELRSAKVN
jgi:hypothetical protein